MHSDTTTRTTGIEDNRDLISADRVTGTNVYDADGTKIGSIDSVMLTKHGGKVAYAIMSFGGFLGIGEKYHPLPWQSLDYDTDLGGYRVPMAGSQLRDAPNYDRDSLDRDDWSSTTEDYYGRPGVFQDSRSYSAADRL
jgi:sporulation protein YlmC with PRC-barrel domain